MTIGNGKDTYADSTLMKENKQSLIRTIRLLEKNLRMAEDAIDKQVDLLISKDKREYENGFNDGVNALADSIADMCECTLKIREECGQGTKCIIWEKAGKLKKV